MLFSRVMKRDYVKKAMPFFSCCCKNLKSMGVKSAVGGDFE
jgi:hypothetical protein